MATLKVTNIKNESFAGDQLYLKSNGYLGIGTTNPGEELEVSADAPSIQLLSTNASGRKYGFQSMNDGKFGIYDGTAGANRIVLASDGKVGIGTTSPGNNLHVKGSGTDVLKVESTDAGAQGTNLILQHSPGAGNMADNDVISLLQFAGVDDSNNATTYSSIRAVATDVSNNSESGDITFHTRNAGTFGERVRIQHDGKLGIGTSSPGTLLHLSAATPVLRFQDSDGTNQLTEISNAGGHTYIKSRNNTSGGNLYINTWDNGNSNYPTLFTILNGGNVGIGTTSPSNKLHVVGITQIENGGSGSQGDAQLFIRKGSGSNACPESITRVNSYLHLGGTEWGANAAGVYTLSFGYTNGTTGTNVPAYIGFKETTTSSYTKGDLVFGLKSSTGDTGPTESFRIVSSGYAQFTGAADIRLTLGNQGTAGTNDANWLRADNTNLMYNSASGDHKWEVGGSEKLRLQSGGGISFNGDTAAANALDDYEEGTWTAALVTGTATHDKTTYRKIGSVVHLWGRLYSPSDTTSSNSVIITGLPFAVADGTAVGSCMAKDVSNKETLTTFVNTAEHLYFYGIQNSNAWNSMLHSNFGANVEVYYHATYWTTA